MDLPQNQHFLRVFRRFSSRVTKSNRWHGICTLAQHWQCDSQKTRSTTRLKCCACHAKWHGRSPKCCHCHEKCNASSENVAKVTQNDPCHVLQHVEMSQSATPATRNEAMWRWKCPKVNPFAEHTIRRHGHMVLTRTVANGCGRLGTVAQRLANTALPPTPPEWNGNPCYAFGKKTKDWFSEVGWVKDSKKLTDSQFLGNKAGSSHIQGST